MAWLGIVSQALATGALAEAYAAMDKRPMPPVYRPAHGDAAGIIRAHSLDPELLRRTFSVLVRWPPPDCLGLIVKYWRAPRHARTSAFIELPLTQSFCVSQAAKRLRRRLSSGEITSR
jgi:hypothetical protein